MNFAKVNFIGNSSNQSSSLQDLKEEDDDIKDVDLTKLNWIDRIMIHLH